MTANVVQRASRLSPMGLLDDAIREHLDLKRRRGADPAEVERAEREALGPVRREPRAIRGRRPRSKRGLAPEWRRQEPTTEAESDDWLHDPTSRGDRARGRVRGRRAEDRAARPPAGVLGDRRRTPRAGRCRPRTSRSARPARVDRRASEEPSLDDGGARRRPPPHPAGDARGRRDGRVRRRGAPLARAASTGADEDVLEETPEFLQDTPDHDRLWFEQRPPRDFDFDG